MKFIPKISLKSDFTIVESTRSWILIRDNCNESHTMSVTNDAENVVSYLNKQNILIGDMLLYSINTDKSVDILKHDGNGNFIGFEFGFDSEDSFYKNIGHGNFIGFEFKLIV